MTELTNTEYVEAFAQALETLAFICLSPAECNAKPEGAMAHCTICCRGEKSLRLNVLAPLALGQAIAANILGIDSSDPRVQVRAIDALNEVMNVTCGALCGLAADASQVPIELGLPAATVLNDPAASWTLAITTSDAQVFDADGSVVALWLEVCP